MSLPRPYPPDIDPGDDGEASAWLRRTDESPEITYRNGGTCASRRVTATKWPPSQQPSRSWGRTTSGIAAELR